MDAGSPGSAQMNSAMSQGTTSGSTRAAASRTAGRSQPVTGGAPRTPGRDVGYGSYFQLSNIVQ